MRILTVTNQYAPVIGGIEILLPQLLPELRARGHEIEIVSSLHSVAREPESVIDGFPIHRTALMTAVADRNPALLLRERKRLAALVERFEPELVHVHDIGPNAWALTRNGLDAPLLIHHLGPSEVAGAGSGPMRTVLKAADWLTGVSASVAEDVLRIDPSLAERMSVITNGIPAPEHAAPYEPDGKRVLCVGRLVEQKAFQVAIRAVPPLLAEHPEARLVFAGDGDQRGSLESLATDLGVTDHVEFLGPVRHADVPSLMAQAAVVAVPSWQEGLPLVVLEAGAAARPVVCAESQGLRDAVVPDVTGTMVAFDDAPGLAAAIASLLADPARAVAYGRAGHRMVREEFTLGRCAEEYHALYGRLAREGVRA